MRAWKEDGAKTWRKKRVVLVLKGRRRWDLKKRVESGAETRRKKRVVLVLEGRWRWELKKEENGTALKKMRAWKEDGPEKNACMKGRWPWKKCVHERKIALRPEERREWYYSAERKMVQRP
jgi:hypothetical protein